MRLHPAVTCRLPAAELRAFSRVEGGTTALHIVFEWGSIVLAAFLAESFWHPVSYVLAVVWIGARLHALGIMAHDGAHHLLFRNRRLNDLVCEVFCAWPVLLSFQSYRRLHLKHHSHLNTADDPDWARNRPDRLADVDGLVAKLRILLGLSGEQRELARFFTAREGGLEEAATRRRQWIRIGYYTAIASVFAATGTLPLLVLYWGVPLFTWFLVAMRIKGVAEHFAVESSNAANAGRTTYLSWPTRLLVAPKNVQYHVEHHLYPSVPFHQLPKLHARMMREAAYRNAVHITHGYIAMLRECVQLARRAHPPSP